MRNLKKILALVLALVMSLSLMATAGAAQFPDVDDSNPYKTAIDVLDELKVFQGFEDGTFKPTDTLNRAQAAVLVYRIATGDVENKYLDNYTYMQQSKFTDLDGYNWAKGYINYCQNAGIVVGTSATTFNPGAQVTGYQLMVMLLRTLGYGKAGEFTDPKGWELETAKIAEREGMLKNVTGGDFGAPAPRQMVAEILFRGLLHDTVEYSPLTPGGYTNSGETLGKRELGLEDIEGVVMANEYASLTGTSTTKDGKTEMLVDDKTYTLETTTTLDDIGENRHAYIQNGTKVIYMENVGNNVWEDVDGKKDTDSNITINSTTERFTNFADGNVYDTSDYLIRYVIKDTVYTDDHYGTLDTNQKVANAVGNALKTQWGYDEDDWTYSPVMNGAVQATNNSGEYEWDASYTVTIKAKTTITSKQLDEIHGIFNGANTKHDYEDSKEYIDGEVYVGTQSYKDISDELSFDGFVEKYLNTHEKAVDNSQNDKGNWLKVIDNDGDGVADYVFKVIYTIAQVSKVKDDTYTLDVKNHTLWNEDLRTPEECGIDALNTLTSQKVVANGDMETGSVVYYAIIDGKAQAYPATVVPSVNIDKYVRKTETVTTTDGNDYIKSDVCEHIEDEAYDAAPELLAGKVNYDLFLVRGDYLGAFVKSSLESDYKLITDGWFDSRKNADEYAVRVYDEESERADKQEIVDITDNGELFIDRDVQNVDHTVDNNDWGALKYLGGVDKYTGARGDLPTNNDGTFKHTCAVAGESKLVDGAALNGGQLLCETDANGNNEHWFIKDGTTYNRIKTTVAAITADGTILPVEDISVSGRYRHSMIDLPDLSKVPTKAAVDGTVYYTNNDTAYDTEGSSDVTVRATSSTVYYVVYPSNTDSGVMVTKSVGYSKAPDVKAWNEKGWVEDIYAVGTLRNPDNDIDATKAEYTADVVVVELSSYENDKSIVLVLDDTTKLSDTRYRELVVITADGKMETRTIRWNTSYVGAKIVPPGLYYMSVTSEKDIYAIQPMSHDQIAEEGGYTTGHVERVNWTNDRYVVIDPYFWNGSASLYGSNVGEEQFDLTAETPLFRVSYDEPGRYDSYGTADVTEGVGSDWDENFLSAAVDIVNKNYSKADLVRDTDDGSIHNLRYYNYNRVLIHHDGKGNVVYAVSFDKLADESGIDDTNNYDVDEYNYAMTVWNNVKPAGAKNTDVEITFGLNLTGADKITVMKNATDPDGVVYTAGDDTATITVSKEMADKGIVRFCILEDAATTLASVVPNNADWVTSEMKRDTTNNKLWHILLTKQDAGLMALAGEDTTAVIWTVAAVDAAIAELQTTIDKATNQLTNEDIAALEELVTTLTDIQDNKVNDYVGVQDTIDTITDKIEEAEEGAAEALIEAKNAALDAITATLAIAEPYWTGNTMGWETLVAEIDAFREEIKTAETVDAVNEIKASALSKITAPATITEEEISENLGASAMLYEAVDAIGVPGEKKIIISTKESPTGYTMTQLLANDDLIKAALAWNDGAKEITGNGTADDPWTSDQSDGRKYVKDDQTPGDGQQKASDFIQNTLGEYLEGKDESFTDDTKLFFAVLDTVAAGIDPEDVNNATVMLQPITEGMLDENGVFVTKFYGTEVTFTVDCSGIQW